MKIKLLLVEDEKELQENLKDILEIHDFEVIVADNGLIALQQLESHDNFDLVVSDILMPKMDGFELLSKVRNELKMINLPFIFLTAKAEKEDLRKGMEFGAEDYLTKPVASKDLINAINTAINKKNKRDEWIKYRIDGVLKEERNVKYHELRTPLFGVMSILELLTSSIEAFDINQIKELLTKAHESSRRLNESLLNLARYGNLSVIIPKKEDIISIHDKVKWILHLSGKGHDLEILADDFSVHFDPEFFDIILNELINNAKKFASDQHFKVTLKEQKITFSNRQNFFDNAQEVKILPFSQIKRNYFEQQGLGLGLFLSQAYAHMHDAEITARIDNDLNFVVEFKFERYSLFNSK